MTTRVLKDNNQHSGYSTTVEREYVMDADVKIPLTHMLDDKLLARYNIIMELYCKWCKAFKLNPNNTTTFPLFYDHAARGQNSRVVFMNRRKPVEFVISNYHKRVFHNLMGGIANANRAMARQSAADKAPVTYHYAKNDEGEANKEPEVVMTEEAKRARLAQGMLKNSQHVDIIKDGRPVLDLGGGNDNLARAMDKCSVPRPNIICYDIIKSADMTFDGLKIADYPGYQLLSNHSSYHMHPSMWVDLIKHNPRGMVMVIDSADDLVQVKGEDYHFSARRITTTNLLAYEVSGCIFGAKKGKFSTRVFAGEVWYSRRQWSDWGFDLLMFPGITSDYVKDHVVLFDRGEKYPLRIEAVDPVPVFLSEGSEGLETSKQPPLYQLFEKDRDGDFRCFYGTPLYQVPKLDGVSLKLTISNMGMVHLTDRTGVTYNLLGAKGNTVQVDDRTSIEFMVELVTHDLKGCRYKLYLNQIVKGYIKHAHDYAEEIVKNVMLFNKNIGGKTMLGIKEGWLTRNTVLTWQTSMPSDGVVYIPAKATSDRFDSYAMPLHSFFKPFQGSDTSPYIINAEQMNRHISGGLKIFYRDDGEHLLHKCPYIEDIQKVFKSHIVNPNDYFSDTVMSPLLYEGYMIPNGLVSDKDTFIITHVRGDKIRRDCSLKYTGNLDWLEKGRFGFTRLGVDGKDVLDRFLKGLSSSRRVKLLPAQVGTYSQFVENFMHGWHENKGWNFISLNKKVVSGIYVDDVDSFVRELKLLLDPGIALYVASTLMRYPHVRRSFYLERGKVRTKISLPLNTSYAFPSFDGIDAFGRE